MSALTLATEGVPSSLAAYNNVGVVAVTQPMNPRETLKKALELTEEIVVVEPKLRVLEFMEMRRLKRSMGQLSQISTEPARRLSQIVELELDANQQAAQTHPATLALSKALKNLEGPAVLTVASQIRGDSDGLLFALEKLHEKGHRVVYAGSDALTLVFVCVCGEFLGADVFIQFVYTICLYSEVVWWLKRIMGFASTPRSTQAFKEIVKKSGSSVTGAFEQFMACCIEAAGRLVLGGKKVRGVELASPGSCGLVG